MGSKSAVHIPFLDQVRGFAVLFVLVYHALGASYGVGLQWNGGWMRDFAALPRTYLPFLPLSLGWSGVAIFFVVSGFCIHLSHEQSQRKEWKVFFLRRLFRIYPPYLVAFLFFALIFPTTRLHWQGTEGLAQIVSHGLVLHNLKEEWFYGVNGSLWSIAVEAQLYLLYPALCWLVRKAGWRGALLAAAACELPLRAIMSFHALPCWLWASPFYYWLSWSLGAKLADDFLKKRPLGWTGRTFPLWVLLTVTADFFCRPLASFSFLFAALAATEAVAWLLQHPEARAPRWFPSAGLQWAGVVSYSVYLIHQPLVLWVGQSLTYLRAPYRLHTSLIFLCTLAFGAVILWLARLFYRRVERPSIEAGKRLIARHAPPLAPATFDFKT